MKNLRSSAVFGAVLGCAILAPATVLARDGTVTVDAWTSVTTPRTVVGPVNIRVRYNALHYAKVSNTVAVAKKEPVDLNPVVAAVPSLLLPTQSRISTFGLRGDVPPAPAVVKPAHDCDHLKPEATWEFGQFFEVALAAGRCYKELRPKFAETSKTLRDALDAYQKFSVGTDTYLANEDAGTPDNRIAAVVSCANRFGAYVEAARGVAGQPQPAPPCSAVSPVPAPLPQIPDADGATKPLSDLAAYLADVQAVADGAFGAGGLSKDQRDVIAARLTAIPATAYAKGGDQFAVYAANYDTLKDAAELLAGLKPDDFFLDDRNSGDCSRDADGEKRTITTLLYDRFDKPDAAPVKKDLLTVDCLSRNAVSAGAGYTMLRGTTFDLQQTYSPATTTTTSRIVANDDVGQFAAAALAHRCLCRHPRGTLDSFLTAGVISSGKSPLGLFGGLSARFSQRYFVNLGMNYGTEATLTNGTLGQVVPNDFKVTTGRQLRLRPALMITIGK